MPPLFVTRRPSPLKRPLMQALVFSLMPLGTAFAQSYPWVRVTHDATEVRSLRQADDVKMSAPKGTVLEVIYVEGDRYRHRDSNWYWVLLPKDMWATRPAGWIRGNDLEYVPPPQPAQTPQAKLEESPAIRESRTELPTDPRWVAAREPAVVEEISVEPVIFSDVVLNFQFGRSELTDEAKRKLASALSAPKPNARMSVALEGYADWVGTEAYNERLGLDRAENVRRYLSEQLRIPAGQISVVSYGENNPAATNSTRQGRALNRRVVIKVGA